MTRQRLGPALEALSPVPGLVAVALLLLPAPGAAQHGDPDFLFEPPKIRLGLHTGMAVPSASSEIFDFTTERLTVNPEDFRSFAISGELAFRMSERFDISVEAGFAGTETASEFREYVGTDDLPIEQTTTFFRAPFTVGVKGYILERGREVGRFAWVPGDWSPFLGAGTGWMWYDFTQKGEFVDFETLDIFRDRFRSSGTTPTVHVLGGIDVSLTPRLVLTGQGRYRWGSVEMGGDFVGFDEIDLSGFEATIGLSARF